MLRVLATPRWVGWTLLAVVVVVGCGGMAYWQLLRAESPTGTLLNAGYAAQWPLFGIFFAVLWWRMLRQEARALAVLVDGDDPEPEPSVTPAEPIADSPFTARPVGVTPGGFDAVPAAGSARAEYNAMLAALAAADRAEHDRGPAGGRATGDTTGTTSEESARP